MFHLKATKSLSAIANYKRRVPGTSTCCLSYARDPGVKYKKRRQYDRRIYPAKESVLSGEGTIRYGLYRERIFRQFNANCKEKFDYVRTIKTKRPWLLLKQWAECRCACQANENSFGQRLAISVC